MIILAMETSAKAVSVALGQDGKLLAHSFQNNGLTHSRTLLPMAEALLANCGMSIRDVDGFAVSIGPGSFTGLRIGIAAVKGLAISGQKPCWGISTLEAMALQSGVHDGIICAAMDARRNQVYNALFDCSNGQYTRLCADRAVALEQVAQDLEKTEKLIFVVGDGAELCYNYLKDHGISCRIVPEHLRWQSAVGVLQVAFSGQPPVSAAELNANYLRLSQAERERLERLARERESESASC